MSASVTPPVKQGAEQLETKVEAERPETRACHLLELHLQHQFVTSTCKTLPGSDNPPVSERWAVHVPPIALKHEVLLHAILAVSAAHLTELYPTNTDYREASKNYFSVVLSEHNRAVSIFDARTADSVCLTCILIAVLAFNFRRTNIDDETWRPPAESLMIGHGCGKIFKMAWRWIQDDPTSEAFKILSLTPQLLDAHSAAVLYTSESDYPAYPLEKDNITEFADLLRLLLSDEAPKNVLDNELWDENIEEAYRRAIGYISFVRKAIEAHETIGLICRRIIRFSSAVPKRFIDLVCEGQPRALLVLAHFFAVTHSASSIWWVGDLATREVMGIYRSLPQKWRPLMQGPLEVMGVAWLVEN